METTSGEEVFAVIATAAGTKNDDDQMEAVVQETGEPATKKQRSHSESQHTEPDVSEKELELLKRHLQSIHSSCGHCAKEKLVRALRRKGAKPLILRLARDFFCPSCQENQTKRPHPVASLEAIPPKWQNIQIDQGEWSHPTESFKHHFSVIIDERCHLKVAKMLFPMKDADLHRNAVWTELRDHYLEQWVCYLGKPFKNVQTAKDLGCQKRQQPSLAGKVSCSNRFQDQLNGRQDMGAHECLARVAAASNAREEVRGLLTTATRFGKSTRSGRQILHTRKRVTSCGTS